MKLDRKQLRQQTAHLKVPGTTSLFTMLLVQAECPGQKGFDPEMALKLFLKYFQKYSRLADKVINASKRIYALGCPHKQTNCLED